MMHGQTKIKHNNSLYFLQLVSKDFFAHTNALITDHKVMQWNAQNYGLLKGWDFCSRMMISGIGKFFFFLLPLFLCLDTFQPVHFECGGYFCTWPQWHKPHPVGLRRSDQPAAESSTSHHIALITDRQPCLWRDSDPQSQQASGRRPTP
jgi:hypothetical protein